MKNYFSIFIISYITILITKFIFIFYLGEQFSNFSTKELIYAIFWGIKFDFAASAIIAFLVTFFDFNKKLFAFFGAIGIITVFLTQISDMLYFDESSRHIGYEIFDVLHDASSLFMTAFSQHTFMFLASNIIALLIFIIIYKLLKNIETTQFNKYYILKKIFIILISVFFIRGMFQHIPLHPWQANEIGNSQLASISVNSVYNIVYTIANKKKKLKPVKLAKIDKEIIEESFKTMYPANNEIINTPILKSKPNIVFFFMESWSAKYMSAYGYKKKTTPYFDELLKKSIRPKFMVAGGHRTTEGIFTSLSSFQNPLGKTIAKTQLQNYKYESIIYQLNKEGYQTSFFQGTSKDTSGTGSLISYLGFQEGYGKRDIKERIYEENYWGVQDTDLYNFITKKLDKKDIKEPFVLGLNNASSHDIVLPKGIQSYNFSENEGLNKKLNTIHYADREMDKFIKNIENKYPNTIFIILADHCGGSLTDNLYSYMIPFAIYSKNLEAKYYDKVLSQRDIAPTIYDLVIGKDEKEKKNYTGKSLFNKSDEFFTDYFHNGVLGWIEEDSIVEINTSTNDIDCYKLDNFDKIKQECTEESSKLKNRALSFTTVSQKLMFEGKTKEFNEYKTLNEQK